MNQRIALLAILWILFAANPNKADAQMASSAVDDSALVKLNATLQAPDADGAAKCQAIFTLFAKYVKVPSTAADLAPIFAEPSWIDQANIQLPPGISGRIPIDWASGGTLFVVYLFPDKTGWSDCVIYLTLTWPSLKESDLVALIKGQPTKIDNAGSWRYIGISEFALCHPGADCHSYPLRSKSVTQDQADKIAMDFVTRHRIRLEDYQPPIARWADSKRIRQACFTLKEELPRFALIDPAEAFCVDVAMDSGRASFADQPGDKSWKILLGDYQGESHYPNSPFTESCWLRLSQEPSGKGHFVVKCTSNGWATPGPEFSDGSFTLEDQAVLLHRVRRYWAAGEWGEELTKLLDEVPQEWKLNVQRREAIIELKANFYDITFKKTH
ncbi:MAG TPA: hypothetical protein VJA94_12300 [Candidatus Angelobacter sp.]